MGLQEPEYDQEVLNSSKTGTETKVGSSNFEKQEPKPELKKNKKKKPVKPPDIKSFLAHKKLELERKKLRDSL